MDNLNHPDFPQPLRAEPPKPALDNGLPEAHDKTTEQIHEMSNFSVSESLGLPLLTKDIGKTGSQSKDRSDSRDAADPGKSYFGYFDSRDRLMAGAATIMILGPLFFGMMRG